MFVVLDKEFRKVMKNTGKRDHFQSNCKSQPATGDKLSYFDKRNCASQSQRNENNYKS